MDHNLLTIDMCTVLINKVTNHQTQIGIFKYFNNFYRLGTVNINTHNER